MVKDVHEQLKKLIHTHDERGRPFAFAGRKKLINEIKAAAEANRDAPIPGQTFVISGAPGAGKTALLRQLLEEWQSDASIMWAKVPGDKKVSATWLKLAEQLTGSASDDIRVTTHKEVSLQGGVAAGVTGTARRTEATTLPPLGIDSCAEIKELANGRFKQPVIVCIDEIQDIQKETKAAEFVRELHTQFDAPVLLVCAGLSNSEGRLRDIGLSQRLSRRHVVHLGLLRASEALEVAQESLKVIAKTAGVSENGLVDMLAEDIATASGNWPRHLTCYLHGVCEALDKQDRPSLSTLNRASALAYGDQLREEYYEDRFDACLLPASVLATLYEKVGAGGLKRKECINLLDEQVKTSRDVEFRESFSSGGEAFEQALRSGVLTLRGFDECEIPIPSLETFIREREREERTRTADSE